MTTFGKARCTLHDVVIDAENTCEKCEEAIAKWYAEHNDVEPVTRYDIASVLAGIASYLSGTSVDYRNRTRTERSALRKSRNTLERVAEELLLEDQQLSATDARAQLAWVRSLLTEKLCDARLPEATVEIIALELTQLTNQLSNIPKNVDLPFTFPATTGVTPASVLMRVEDAVRTAYIRNRRRSVAF